MFDINLFHQCGKCLKHPFPGTQGTHYAKVLSDFTETEGNGDGLIHNFICI